jgi:hypothetical protein
MFLCSNVLYCRHFIARALVEDSSINPATRVIVQSEQVRIVLAIDREVIEQCGPVLIYLVR